jgi:glycosyltransferase involved in cell wall biosynthesis
MAKLLYAFPEPLPLERARGIQTVHTVRALAEQGIDVVLAHVPAGADPFASCGLAQPANVELLPVSHRLGWPLERFHSNRLFAARLARRLRQGRGVGAIMVRHLKVARFLLRDFPDVPLLYEAHEVFADTARPAKREGMARLEGRVVRKAAALVANSNATAARLAALYRPGRRIEVIPNGVDYRSLVPEKDWQRASERVIYSGSFFGWKGAEDLVAAARALPGFCIRLLGGDAAGIDRLRRKAGEGGARLEFAGRVPHERVAEELARACIAVLPNRAEPDSAYTSPIKLFEYMAAGCALVVTDLPAVREILQADEAVWVPPGEPEALARALRALAAQPERARAMAARVREKAKRYTWSARGQRLALALGPLLAGG